MYRKPQPVFVAPGVSTNYSMIVTSKLTNEVYFWIKNPRTGTVSYSHLFNPILKIIPYIHTHEEYKTEMSCTCNGIVTKFSNLNGVAIIRNPLTRFISALQHLKYVNRSNSMLVELPTTYNKICSVCGSTTQVTSAKTNTESELIFPFYDNETVFYEFMYDNFDKNCQPKSGDIFERIFQTTNSILLSVGRTLLLTQVYWAYHPKIQTFRYENLSEFNLWVEQSLGYNTSKLKRVNSQTDTQLPIDFTTNKFKSLVKHLFYDDFRYFNYEFPI